LGVGGCGEGKGPPEAGISLRGKGILRLGSGQVAAAASAFRSAPPFGGARLPRFRQGRIYGASCKIFRFKKMSKKVMRFLIKLVRCFANNLQ